MLNKCANPACSAKFLRLHEGRLFITGVEDEDQSNTSSRERQRQYFWLCSSCCRTMTLIARTGEGVQVVPLPEAAPAARAAS